MMLSFQEEAWLEQQWQLLLVRHAMTMHAGGGHAHQASLGGGGIMHACMFMIWRAIIVKIDHSRNLDAY